jgi:putative transposase
MKDYVRIQVRSRNKTGQRAKKTVRRLCSKERAIAKGMLEEKALQGAKRSLDFALRLERDEFLERGSHERVTKGKFRGHRNGFAPRTIGLGGGQVEIKMPKVVRGPELYESKILPAYMRTAPSVLETLPLMYLNGMSGGDFRETMKALFGERAVLSDSSIARMKAHWYDEYKSWSERPLDSSYAYIYADGVHIKVGTAPNSLALLVVIGVDWEGRKHLLAMLSGGRESYSNWLDTFRHLASRGVVWVGMVIADGIQSLWSAVHEVFPQARHQRDWVHKIANVLDKLPADKRLQARALKSLQRIYSAPSREDSLREFDQFAKKFADHRTAVDCLLKDKAVLISYFDFPREHWIHLRTSNPVESPFNGVKTRVRKARRIVLETSAYGLVFHLLMKAERRWSRFNAPALAGHVIYGAQYRNGKQIKAPGRHPLGD